MQANERADVFYEPEALVVLCNTAPMGGENSPSSHRSFLCQPTAKDVMHQSRAAMRLCSEHFQNFNEPFTINSLEGNLTTVLQLNIVF